MITKRRALAVGVPLVLASSTLVIRLGEKAPNDSPPLSALTFDDLESGMIRNGLTSSQLESYSDRLRGTRVRWTGYLGEQVQQNGLTNVSTNGVIPNIEFILPSDVDSKLQTGQLIGLYGHN